MASRDRNPSIVMTSPPDRTRGSPHPRRTSAKHSVSLLHSSRPPSSKLQHEMSASPSDDGLEKSNSIGESGHTDSPSSLQALGGRGSSGESSNAETWFEKSNNEVKENSASFENNDPPFFLRNSSSSETPPDLRRQMTKASNNEAADSLPLRTGLLQLGTDGSSTDDFRGVIDDLTIENKKLKRRLKKYEKLHDSHLKDEKLFEVRIHGLPPEKKRELEETLRKFASSLGTSGANAFPPDGYASLMPMLKGAKAASSPRSFQNADSAYASMSASGQGSSAQSGNDFNQRMTPSQYPATRRQNIQNYLHDIPEGLLPQQHPATMTERAKKKLVVRRMEQIFAGKGPAASGHQQSIQQQEVSQSAARTDRSVVEASGQRARQEGSREALIMNRETEDPLDRKPGEKQTVEEASVQQHVKDDHIGQQDFADQRPTRPLDLDPHRAQIPSDNIRYLRQMGFSPHESESTPAEGHGWIYLNFLINMAQLHTLNVTFDFVRKALTEYSQKFEISGDGRRVRWNGGSNLTTSTSTGGTSSNDCTNENTPDRQSPRKRLKLSHDDSAHHNGGASQRLRSENSKYSYTPLFSHRDHSEQGDDSSPEEEEDEDSSSPFPPLVAGDSSGMTSSGIRTTAGVHFPSTKRKQKHDDGPIIFYSNARFCTDLTGDRKLAPNHYTPVYSVASHTPIGGQKTTKHEGFEVRGPLAHALNLPEPMDLCDNPIPHHMEISFPEHSPQRPHSSSEQAQIDLEVTGIGGVWPADNVSISVKSRHARVEQNSASVASAASAANPIPPRFANILRGSDPEATNSTRVQKQVVASKVQRLPPSDLPPALSFMPSDEESEDDSDDDEEGSEAPESPGAMPPAAAPQPVALPYVYSEDDEEEEQEESDDEESDGEVDFLAGVREYDPEAVRQQEREYEAHIAERLAEELPVGSSAATAGGGSGFASPADGVNRQEHQRAMKDARRNSRNRAQAVDSMDVNYMKDLSSSESSDDEGSVRS